MPCLLLVRFPHWCHALPSSCLVLLCLLLPPPLACFALPCLCPVWFILWCLPPLFLFLLLHPCLFSTALPCLHPVWFFLFSFFFFFFPLVSFSLSLSQHLPNRRSQYEHCALHQCSPSAAYLFFSLLHLSTFFITSVIFFFVCRAGPWQKQPRATQSWPGTCCRRPPWYSPAQCPAGMPGPHWR